MKSVKSVVKFFLLCVLCALSRSNSPAAQLTINLGATNNDGTGDTLRVFAQKCQTNFLELYNAVRPIGTNAWSSNAILSTPTITNLTAVGSNTIIAGAQIYCITNTATDRFTNTIWTYQVNGGQATYLVEARVSGVLVGGVVNNCAFIRTGLFEGGGTQLTNVNTFT